jgi:hypothetical protein
MTGHNGQDIIEQIDSLTEPGRDAATWTRTGAHETQEWNTPSPGNMIAILLDTVGLTPIEISLTDPVQDIARLVGDPIPTRIRHLSGVDFWIGDNSQNTAPINDGATAFLHALLEDVRDGAYVASDTDRDHVRRVLSTPGAAPAVHGPCLITGVANDRDRPAPLSDNFQDWYSAGLDRVAGLRAEIAAVVADELGIPVEQIERVVVLHLS